MQIHSFHNVGHAATPPLGLIPAAIASEPNRANVEIRRVEVGGGGANGELDQLARQLGQVSEVRSDVVAAAKLKVQRGDYLNRATAEVLADTLLSRDAWNRPSVTD